MAFSNYKCDQIWKSKNNQQNTQFIIFLTNFGVSELVNDYFFYSDKVIEIHVKLVASLKLLYEQYQGKDESQKGSQ